MGSSRKLQSEVLEVQVLLKSQSMKMGKGVRHVLRTCSHPVPSRYLAELCGVGTCGEPRAAFPTVSCAFLLLARLRGRGCG